MHIMFNLFIRHSAGTSGSFHPGGSFLHYVRTYTVVVISRTLLGNFKLLDNRYHVDVSSWSFVVLDRDKINSWEGGNKPYVETAMNLRFKTCNVMSKLPLHDSVSLQLRPKIRLCFIPRDFCMTFF
jgi:hypothetical protein